MAIPQPQSAAASLVRAWIGFVLLLLAQFAVRPLISTRASVDFLVIAVLFASVRMRPGLAALVGFAAGIAVDALVPSAFGAAAISFTAVAFVASRVKAVFFADHVALTALFVFVGKLIFDALNTAFSGAARGSDLVVQLLLWTPLSAALTALVAVVLLTVFRPLFRPAAG
jgi:rod shape-determining protein MreD